MGKRAIIIGAGPAGLTAALEFLRKTDVKPVVLEASQEIGGISRTIRYKGNRMDIGGHRFFSKSDRVMQWWMDLMPPEDAAAEISYQGKQRVVAVPAHLPEEPPLRGLGPLHHEPPMEEDLLDEEEEMVPDEEVVAVVTTHEPESADLVMLVRPRKSRIYYLRKFFDYPIKLSRSTIENLGPARMTKIGVSYVMSRVRPIEEEKSLEDFLINRFGRELYLTFFKSYTEKVWGTPCDKISAEWGAQRIKGLSLTTALKHFVKKALTAAPKDVDGKKDITQKGTDTSLIERFLYPKFGPGQLWEHVADQVVALGGDIRMGWKVVGILTENGRVVGVEAVSESGERQQIEGDYFLSTMPMRDLVRAMDAGGAAVPASVREVSEGLEYRDFITVGVLANKLDVTEPDGGLVKDTWIYIQEPDVQIGRLQIFNNWSPYMLADPTKVWIGLEYFCYETDALWSMPDEALKTFAAGELEKIGILKTAEVLDSHVVRVPKTYPAYFGTYDRFDELRVWVDTFENLYLVGRNGMHKYNNQDHSMLTAMAVVDGIAAGHVDKKSVWSINTEQEYHEEKAQKQ
ncbi:NAD(P)-binding protein [Granulicella sp. 5B5]|uniref:NAD(P)/FAD-dependent oxidoreductase n=1 Tax=Granulicella sp. 5B5 TaxID=1617967 RepID=UPI0015F6E86A|nr:NAD(P)/FAD-dependent oxidoreductase [Granulicella sp. 5B5]QMV18815.1 NAD(P)-binding protein [Granulicella sp. 5B5]